MSVWREVQEALYQRVTDAWAARTPLTFGNETFDPPAAPWVRFSVVSVPGQQGTLGARGQRKWDRAGRVFFQLREPPGNGVGTLSDLAGIAKDVFEGCRFEPHDIRFGVVDIGDEVQVEDGRWWGVTVQGRFDYEETR